MKRFLYNASVTSAEGSQTFYIDAETKDEADARAKSGDTDGIMYSEVEVQGLSSLEYDSETTTDDCGDFPENDPAKHKRTVEAPKVGRPASKWDDTVEAEGFEHAIVDKYPGLFGSDSILWKAWTDYNNAKGRINARMQALAAQQGKGKA